MTEHPRPSVTVDVVAFALRDGELSVLLVRRGEAPFAGRWALPGGFVEVSDEGDQGEDLEQAARRELAEETGLAGRRLRLEQLHTFGKPGRDPRGRVITVAYLALVRPDLVAKVRAGSDAADTSWKLAAQLDRIELAFDHRGIVERALDKLRACIDHTSVAFELASASFTIAELRAVHDAVKGRACDPGNFRRRFLRLHAEGVIQRVPGRRPTGTKPARVYRYVRPRKRSRR
jgi:8-oxo-dGTP diphosphatase